VARGKSERKSSKKSADQANKVTRYVRQTRGELRKVTWPSRQESQRLTAIVLGVTAAMALFLGLLDFGFSRAVQGLVSLVLGS